MNLFIALFLVLSSSEDFVCFNNQNSNSNQPDGFSIIWTTKHPLPRSLAGSGCAVINDTVYVIGGRDSSGNRFNLCYMYIPAQDTWIARASMPTARAHIACAVVKGKIYAIGGWVGPSATGACEEFNPATNTWTVKENMPTPRYVLGVITYNDRIYCIGGMNMQSQVFGTNEVYNPDSNTWVTKASMPTPRMGGATFLINNKIYVAGGSNLGSALTVHEMYDINGDRWQNKAPLQARRYAIGAWTFQGKGYAIGGYDYSRYHTTVEVYDTLNDRWSYETSMQYGRQSIAVGLIQNRVYVIGGWNNGSLIYNEEGTIQVSITEAEKLKVKKEILIIQPNPSKKGTNILIRGFRMQDNTLKIYDTSGKLVKKLAISPGDKHIWVSLRPGIYFVHSKINNLNITRKIVIEE